MDADLLVIMVWFLSYCVSFAKYIVVYRTVGNHTEKRVGFLLIGGVVYFIIVGITGGHDISLYALNAYINSMVYSFLFSFKLHRRPLCLWLSMIFIVLWIEQVFLSFMRTCYLSDNAILNNAIVHVIVNASILLVFGILFFIKMKRTEFKEAVIRKIRENSLIITIGMLLLFVFCISFYDWNSRNKMFSFTGGVEEAYLRLVYLLIGLLGMMAIHAEKERDQKEKYLLITKELMHEEREHYRLMLEREHETKKYRHDAKNHFLCLREYAKEGRLDKVKEYLDELTEKERFILADSINSGNVVVDSLTEYYSKQVGDNASFELEGRVLAVKDEVKLCVIYSNLLKNAVEEVSMCTGKAYISVKLYSGKNYYRIEVRNSLSKKDKHREKAEYDNKGLGLINIQDMLREKEEGLEIIKTDAEYTAIATVCNR